MGWRDTLGFCLWLRELSSAPELEYLATNEAVTEPAVTRIIAGENGASGYGYPRVYTNFDGVDEDGAYLSQYALAVKKDHADGKHLDVGNGALTVVGSATSVASIVATAALIGTLTVSGNAAVTGTLSAGATTLASLAVTAGATVGTTLGVTGAAALNGGTTTTTLTATGNVALGDANTDTLTVIGVSTFKNAAGSAVQLYVDAGNNRVIVGSSTALGSDTTPNLQVVGRLYLAPDGGGNDQALFLRHNNGAVGSFTLGATNSATPDLIFKNNAGTQIARLLTAGGAIVGTSTAFVGAEKLLVNGGALLQGATTVSTGGLTVTAGGLTVSAGSSTFAASVTVSSGGIGVTGSSVFNSGVTVLNGINVTTGNASFPNTGIGFFGTSPIVKPTVTGAKAGNAALTSLMTTLANLGLLTDSTT